MLGINHSHPMNVAAPRSGSGKNPKRPLDCRTTFEHLDTCDDERIEAFRPPERTSSCKQQRSSIFFLMLVCNDAC